MAKHFQFPSLFDDLQSLDLPAPPPALLPSPALEPAATTSEDQLPPDHLARTQALDIRQSWIVEAPAGSGKTGLLIQRLLKLLADETVSQPEEVLAITFTRAATEEIRDRVVGQLEAARDNLPATSAFDRATRTLALHVLARDRHFGWNLLQDPRRINIRTIDSVCAQIMSGLPVLSGGAGYLATTENADELYREAARNVLLRLGGSDTDLHIALRTVLLHRDGDLANCEKLLMEMLRSREQWGDLISLTRPHLDDEYLEHEVRPRLDRALEQVICAELTRLESALTSPFLHRLTQAAAELSGRLVYGNNPSSIAVCSNRYNAPEARVADLEHWRALLHLLVKPKVNEWRVGFNKNHVGFETDKIDKALLSSLVDEARQTPDLLAAITRASRLPPAEYPEDQWKAVKALFRVLRAALTELQLVFAQHGQCDFAESALQARTALRDESGPGDLRAAFGLELQHLLVDEMQDTSSSQYELIDLLTRHWPGERRTVFLVGDPKQSIYLFRHARVERFLRAMREGELGSLTLGALHLTANFRSEASLVDSFNQDFSQVFPPPSPVTDIASITFTPVQAIRGRSPRTSPDTSRAWHTHVLTREISDQQQSRSHFRQNDARIIRELIIDWRSRPLPPGRSKPWRIAVLVRARQHLLEIIAALRGTSGEAAIPYHAIKIEQLGDRPEILDLLALTRALLHPADRISWLSILRAPWCGLELAELHLLTGADDPSFKNDLLESLMERHAPLLAPQSRERLDHLHRVMRSAIAQTSELALPELVERAWRSLGGHLTLTPDQQQNTNRFFSLLDQLSTSPGRIDLAQLTQQVKTLYAETSATPDAVDLMTIHLAKGLEWDVVFVPALDRSTGQTTSKLLNWEELDTANPLAAHVLLAPIHGSGDAASDLNRFLANLAKEREAEERKRLFYVACTRAREALHLFATVPLSRSGEPSVHANSLLSAAWPAAKHFVEQASTAPRQQAEPQSFLLQIAASAEEPARKPTIVRLPNGINPLTGRTTPTGLSNALPPSLLSAPQTLSRPEGSLLARTFGNTLHALLDRLTHQIATGISPDDLLQQLPQWRDRISALLRSGGVPPKDLGRLARDVQTALSRTLADPTGLWILKARATAATELSLTTWKEAHVTVRVDRLFTAGNDPLTEGQHCLWLVDYKTATHGRGDLQLFLAQQRTHYARQLETYAHLLQSHHGTTETRVALYFPLLSQLVWWRPADL